MLMPILNYFIFLIIILSLILKIIKHFIKKWLNFYIDDDYGFKSNFGLTNGKKKMPTFS